MPDWISGVFTIGGVIIGTGVTLVIKWMEEKSRLRIMTFEKRLGIHQQAFSWCHKLSLATSLVNNEPSNIIDTADHALQWWNDNCLFLDSHSREEMMLLIHTVHLYAIQLTEEQKGNISKIDVGTEVTERLGNTLKAIVEGIGRRYLPEMKDSGISGSIIV